MNSSGNSKTPKVIGAFVVAAVIAAGVITFIVVPNKNKQTDTQTNSSASTSQENTPETTESTSTNSTQQGTFESSMSYRVPEGSTNTINVTATINSSGVIEKISTNTKYVDQESVEYIQGFESEVQSQVVSKKISDLSPSIIGGASLTSQAFFNALNEISNKIEG